MIDVENMIFDAAYDDVAPLCAKNGYRSVPGAVPTVFPAVNLYEIDNRTDYDRESTQSDEDYAVLAYEAHVYALSRKECRKVFAALDGKLTQLNMTRISGSYTPNRTNAKVHEYVARYRVGADRNGILYRRR